MNNPNNAHQPSTETADSWDSRIANAAIFLGLSVEETVTALKELGVDKEPAGMEMLSDEAIVPFGDLRKAYCDDLGIAIAKVRMAMKYLRGPKDSNKTDSIDPETIKMKEKYGVKLKLEHIPTDQLLEDYNPNKHDHPITTVLRGRFGEKPVIVFKPDSTEVDIEQTANYIADLDNGFPEETTIESQGELVRLYMIGEIPSQIIEEDPLSAGSPLKRGRSIVNRVNWSDISIEKRQFIRLLVDEGYLNHNDRREIKDILQMAKTGIQELKDEFPEVALVFRERGNMHDLPNLTMTMAQANTAKTQNPFGIKRQY